MATYDYIIIGRDWQAAWLANRPERKPKTPGLVAEAGKSDN